MLLPLPARITVIGVEIVRTGTDALFLARTNTDARGLRGMRRDLECAGTYPDARGGALMYEASCGVCSHNQIRSPSGVCYCCLLCVVL